MKREVNSMDNRLLWIVLNGDGTYAGVPCESWEEAFELMAQNPDRKAYILDLAESDVTYSTNGHI